MDPGAACRRSADGLHLAHPDVRFALLALVPVRPLFSRGSRNTHKGFLRAAPQHRSGGRMHCQYRLEEKATPTFVANLAHAADLVTMRQVNVGRILHQQDHGSSCGLGSGLLNVRLHQGCKGDIRLAQPSIEGFGRFPGVRLSWQRAQRIRLSGLWPLGPLVGCDADRAGGRLQRSARPSSWGPTSFVSASCYSITLVTLSIP